MKVERVRVGEPWPRCPRSTGRGLLLTGYAGQLESNCTKALFRYIYFYQIGTVELASGNIILLYCYNNN